MDRRTNRRWGLAALLVLLVSFVAVGTVFAAQTEGGDAYRLLPDETVTDDLYVVAGEVYIDGTVEGDVVAVGGYVEINGTVTGDVIAAGGGIAIRGEVQDDARVAGAGVDIAGRIGGDLVAVAGGGEGPAIPVPIGGRTIVQGLRLSPDTQVGQDALLAGGSGELAGTIERNLNATIASLTFAAAVGGDANLDVQSLQLGDAASVEGTLRYSAPQSVAGIEGVAEDVQYEAPAEPQPTLARRLLGWLTRTGLILVGFVLLGWLLLRLAPNLLLRPADELSERPAVAGIYGLIAAVLFLVIPLLSALIVVLIGIFWGVGPALIVALFLLAAFALIWVFSPLVSGLWLGRAISGAMGRTFSNLPALALGVVILALLGRVPCLGAIVYLLSFILALGAIILARRSEPPRPLPPLAPPAVGSDFEAAPLA